MKITPVLIMMLVLTKKITEAEADHLQVQLPLMKAPDDWRYVFADIERLLSRKLT